MTIKELEKLFPGKILPFDYPKPYPNENPDTKKIKAIVLGCDPSNFSKKGGITKELETVFGISGIGKDGRYFSGILRNLKLLGLSLDDIYVQNLCRNYFSRETAKNSDWNAAAKHWAISLKKELDELKLPKSIPVFLTAKHLYEALLKENTKKYKPQDIYENPLLIPINHNDNILERPLIPLYRGGTGNAYGLDKWENYKNRIIEILAESKK